HPAAAHHARAGEELRRVDPARRTQRGRRTEADLQGRNARRSAQGRRARQEGALMAPVARIADRRVSAYEIPTEAPESDGPVERLAGGVGGQGPGEQAVRAPRLAKALRLGAAAFAAFAVAALARAALRRWSVR